MLLVLVPATDGMACEGVACGCSLASGAAVDEDDIVVTGGAEGVKKALEEENWIPP